MKSKDELLKLLAEYVKDMEDEKIKDIAREYLEAGYPAKVLYCRIAFMCRCDVCRNRYIKG